MGLLAGKLIKKGTTASFKLSGIMTESTPRTTEPKKNAARVSRCILLPSESRPTNAGGALSDYADQAGVSAHLAPTYGCLNTQSPNRVESTRPCTKVALAVACFRFCSLSSLVRDESILDSQG